MIQMLLLHVRTMLITLFCVLVAFFSKVSCEGVYVTMDSEDCQIVAHKRGISYNINEAVKIIV